jgi:peptide/nickel transport system ATP-binding protein
VIASAIAMRPRYLIADEPTTALDSTVALGVLGLLGRLRDEGMGMLLISHDLATVSRIASHVAVMQHGLIVEMGTVSDVLGQPRHPYTRELIAAVPTNVPRHQPLLFGNSGVNPPRATVATSSTALTPEFPNVLAAEGLVRTFGTRTAVDDVSLTLTRGETLGIVGESGSGKTTVARLLLGLDRPDAGTVTRNVKLGAIYQDALSSFDPRWTVRQILSDAATAGRSRRHDVSDLLTPVGLPAEVAARSPRHLSGGQQQRVSIARAIAANPDVLICDEPVSNLDVIAQAQVLDLLDDLQRRRGLSLVFISHDLGVVRHMSDHVLVMRDGRVVEEGTAGQVFDDPQHDYTRALIAAAPTLG